MKQQRQDDANAGGERSKSEAVDGSAPASAGPPPAMPGAPFELSAPMSPSMMFWAKSAEPPEPVNPLAAASRAVAEGEALMRQQRFAAAMQRFEQAVSLLPNEVEFHYRLVGAADMAGRADLAERHLQESVRLDPCFALGHFGLARVHRRAGKLDRALHHSAAAVALEPRNPHFVAEHGNVLLLSGEVRQAWEMVQAMIENPDPRCPALIVLYARIALKIGEEEKALAAVERVLQSPDLTSDRESRPRLQLAAAELLDKLGRYDEAFAKARAANDLMLATSPPHEASIFIEMVTQKINYFTPQRLRSLPRATHGDRRPVFIVGMPRSGTTLVEQILASHSEVCAGGEIELLRKLHWARDIAEWSNNEPYPQSLEMLTTRGANRLAERYLSTIRGINASATYVTDKMPFNLLALEMVELLLPGCHVIYCVRNPLDTGLSCYMTHFADSNEYKFDLAHIGTCLRYSGQLMQHWKETLSLPILEVRYEDLILDTEAQARRMLSFVGLPWEGQCLEFHRSRRSVQTASEDQVRRPIYTSSISRWKHYEAHLGPLFEALRRAVE